jgi:hypothetical protein
MNTGIIMITPEGRYEYCSAAQDFSCQRLCYATGLYVVAAGSLELLEAKLFRSQAERVLEAV